MNDLSAVTHQVILDSGVTKDSGSSTKLRNFPLIIAGRVEKINEFPLDDSPATRPYKITRLPNQI
ncbi:hypothetical protein [Coleofasciculus chthonoplastes]|uniref:hypothetical protein n=1 Tax=Coleofasciculus chthonoplastes TaxID=64178 RepID=UPI004064370C